MILCAAACTRGEPTSTAPTASGSQTSETSPGESGDTVATEASGGSLSGNSAGSTAAGSTESGDTTAATTTTTTTGADAMLADVLSVSARGSSFSVEIRSPDLGCSQYADWWEVVTPGGELVYRRILAHSHVDEQPFTRSGGPVEVGAEDTVIVRAHMNPGGYGGRALRGSASAGFSADPSITASFAADLATAEPLPSGCAF